MGLEPTISAWKANVLPLHYARKMVKKQRAAPCKGTRPLLVVRAKRLELIHLAVLEPKSSASANSATPA